MRLTTLTIGIILLLFTNNNFAQLDKILNSELTKGISNVYDFSTPLSQTIQIKLWGASINPGLYKIDNGTKLAKLLTYAGGLSELAELDEIKIIRQIDNNGKNKFQTFVIDYEKVLEDNYENISNEIEFKLLDGDIIFVPQSTSWYKSITPVTTIVSAITSIVTLIFLINNK